MRTTLPAYSSYLMHNLRNSSLLIFWFLTFISTVWLWNKIFCYSTRLTPLSSYPPQFSWILKIIFVESQAFHSYVSEKFYWNAQSTDRVQKSGNMEKLTQELLVLALLLNFLIKNPTKENELYFKNISLSLTL